MGILLKKIMLPLVPLIVLKAATLFAQDSQISGGYINDNKGKAFVALDFDNKPFVQLNAGSGDFDGFSNVKFNLNDFELNPFISQQTSVTERENGKTESSTFSGGIGIKKQIGDNLKLNYQGAFINDSNNDTSSSNEKSVTHEEDASVPYSIDITVEALANVNARAKTSNMGHYLGVGYKNLEGFLVLNNSNTSIEGNSSLTTKITTDGEIAGTPLHSYSESTVDTPITQTQGASQGSLGISYYFAGPALAAINARTDTELLSSMNAWTSNNAVKGSIGLTFKISSESPELEDLIEPCKELNYINFSNYNKDVSKTKTDLIKRKYFKDTVNFYADTENNFNIDLNKNDWRAGIGRENNNSVLKLGYKSVDAECSLNDTRTSYALKVSAEF